MLIVHDLDIMSRQEEESTQIHMEEVLKESVSGGARKRSRKEEQEDHEDKDQTIRRLKIQVIMQPIVLIIRIKVD